MQETNSSPGSTAVPSGAAFAIMMIGIWLAFLLLVLFLHKTTSDFEEDMASLDRSVEALLRSAEMPESQIHAISMSLDTTTSHVKSLVYFPLLAISLCMLFGFQYVNHRLGKLERQIRNDTPAIKAPAST
jgi:predicted RND superfamily exporter protein